MEKKDISFLLGAGFSVDAGYPTAKQLNERLRKINKDEILIDGSGISFLLKPGEVDVNANLSNKKRKFVQEFLEFYVSNELSSEDEFDYELFYDWAIERSNKNDNLKLQAFIDDYQKGVPVEMKQSCSQLIDDFFRTYNQLIYQMLFRPVERIHYSTFPNYQIYLRFLSKLGNNHIVHIHTLNHDLFMEQLCILTSSGRHSDGLKTWLPIFLVIMMGIKSEPSILLICTLRIFVYINCMVVLIIFNLILEIVIRRWLNQFPKPE